MQPPVCVCERVCGLWEETRTARQRSWKLYGTRRSEANAPLQGDSVIWHCYLQINGMQRSYSRNHNNRLSAALEFANNTPNKTVHSIFLEMKQIHKEAQKNIVDAFLSLQPRTNSHPLTKRAGFFPLSQSIIQITA